MRSEALEITLIARGESMWIVLKGPFHDEQIPQIREKINGLIRDGVRMIVLDIEHVRSAGESVVSLCVNMTNTLRGKGGDLKLIFNSNTLTRLFSSYRHILSIYPNAHALERGKLRTVLKRSSRYLTKKTGVRISRGVALSFLFLSTGWFSTLLIVIYLQSTRITEQHNEIDQLSSQLHSSTKQLQILQKRIGPLIQLGIVDKEKDPDSTSTDQ